jgi:hypothetical protein
MDRRMKVLALRRDGYTIAAVAEAIESTMSRTAADLKWLRDQGYDIGEGHTGRPLPAPGAERHAQLRAIAAADDEAVTRREVSDRRIRGEDILSISIAMGIPAHEVRRHMQDAARIAHEGDMEQRRALQLARLDKLLLNLEEGIQDGNPKAINAAVRVIAEGNRLQGLYLPIQVEHTVITVDVIDREMERLTAKLAEAEAAEARGLPRYIDVDGEPVDE